MTHAIMWEFFVRDGYERKVEEACGPTGAWAALFKRSAEYIGTDLLRDATNIRRYITIDRWSPPDAFERFRSENAHEYEVLDARCETWTETETKMGDWMVTT